MWVNHLNRFPTRQRLPSWGLITSLGCCLCSLLPETRDHMFLTCDYSSEIQKLVITRLSPTQQLFCSWFELLFWTRQSSLMALPTLKKLVAHASVFHIWKQKNNVLHNLRSIPPLIIFQNIDREVRNTITSRRHIKHWRNLMFL